MDTGGIPEQFGVILLLDEADGFDLSRARRTIGERVPAVPRLRQRLVRTPLGCGGPIWVDDDGFDIDDHVRAVVCSPPGDHQLLLDTAVSIVTTALPRTAPLWAAVLVTGLADGRAALVLVLHHVLADGLGGLAVVGNLVDQGAAVEHGAAAAAGAPFPRPRPTAGRLAVDAFTGRVRGLRHARQGWRLLRGSIAAGGGLRPPRAARCSLIAPTGPRRRLAVIEVDLATLSTAAHRHGATTNDALLVAVAGALHRVLRARGESVDAFAVAVPVSGRGESGPAVGNAVSPLLVPVPATGEMGRRLERVAARVRAHKAAATGPPPVALLGWLFRPLAAFGGYRWYMNHQHRLHTLVSHLRGPGEQLSIGGSAIRSAIPVATAECGNLTVYFEALSYAGTLTVAAISDPDHFLDIDTLTQALRAELDLIIHTPAIPRGLTSPDRIALNDG